MKKLNPNKINVYMLSNIYLPHYSGPSKQGHQINQVLVNKGVGIKVITKNKNETTEVVDNITVIRLPRDGFEDKYEKKKSTLFWAIHSCLYLIKSRKNIDIVHALDSYSTSALFSLTCFIIRKPIIIKNSIAREAFNANKLHKVIKLWILKRFANIVAISQETRNELSQSDFNQDRVFFIPNGVDHQLFRPIEYTEKHSLKKRLGIEHSRYIAITVGLLNKRKGTDILLKVWKKIVQNDKNSLLLLIGPAKDKEFFDQLQKFIIDENLEENILILGNKENIQEYLKIADIFVFPSEREGLPNALLEAMSSSLPCVARNIGGVTDLIQDEVNGLLCKEVSEERLIKEFFKKISWLKNNIELSNKLGENARKFIINNYSLDFIANEYYRLYKELM